MTKQKTITILSCKDNFSGYTEFKYEMPLEEFIKRYVGEVVSKELAEIIEKGFYDDREDLRSRR